MCRARRWCHRVHAVRWPDQHRVPAGQGTAPGIRRSRCALNHRDTLDRLSPSALLGTGDLRNAERPPRCWKHPWYAFLVYGRGARESPPLPLHFTDTSFPTPSGVHSRILSHFAPPARLGVCLARHPRQRPWLHLIAFGPSIIGACAHRQRNSVRPLEIRTYMCDIMGRERS